jgi:hypothetical protein
MAMFSLILFQHGENKMNLSDEGALSSSVVCHGDFLDVKTT